MRCQTKFLYGAVSQPDPIRRRAATSARGGTSGGCAKQLMVVMLAATTIATGCCEGNISTTRDEDPSQCQQLLASNPQPLAGFSFRNGDNGENFGEFRTLSPGGWQLQIDVRFHVLDLVDENSTWTVLCVGLVDSTVYSTGNSSENAASIVKFSTRGKVAVGLVRLKRRCWMDSRRFADCSSSFIPLLYFINLLLYNNSPLEQKFWIDLNSTAMNVNPRWIWKLSIQTIENSIPSHWIHNMNMSSLEELQITGNTWNSPNKMFAAMVNLTNLDIRNNSLNIVPEDMVRSMPNLQSLSLGYNNLSRYPSEISLLANLVSLDITNNFNNKSLRILDDDINHLPRSLKILKFENTKLDANITRFVSLPQLIFLNLSRSELNFTNDGIVTNGTYKFEILDLSHNNLNNLSTVMFKKLNKLKILILSHNNLQEWPSDIFDDNVLTNLYLSNNTISKLIPDTFNNLRVLEFLDLSLNNIEHLPEEIFWKTSVLKYLDLSHNKLTNISDTLFTNSSGILEINFSHNMLTHIHNLFELKLISLDFSFNNITEFNMSSVDDINLSNNSVQVLGVSSVKRLNMSYNSLSYVSSIMWANMTQVKEVDLGGNAFNCCLFKNTSLLNEVYDTKIWNLGTLAPIQCSINNQSEVVMSSFVYNELLCRAAQEEGGLQQTPEDSGMTLQIVLTVLLTVFVVALFMVVMIFRSSGYC